jgi:hypothetical protein
MPGSWPCGDGRLKAFGWRSGLPLRCIRPHNPAASAAEGRALCLGSWPCGMEGSKLLGGAAVYRCDAFAQSIQRLQPLRAEPYAWFMALRDGPGSKLLGGAAVYRCDAFAQSIQRLQPLRAEPYAKFMALRDGRLKAFGWRSGLPLRCIRPLKPAASAAEGRGLCLGSWPCWAPSKPQEKAPIQLPHPIRNLNSLRAGRR